MQVSECDQDCWSYKNHKSGVKSWSRQPCFEFRTNPKHHSSFMQKREIWPVSSLAVSENWVRRLRRDQIFIKSVDERQIYRTLTISTHGCNVDEEEVNEKRGEVIPNIWLQICHERFKVLLVLTKNTSIWNLKEKRERERERERLLVSHFILINSKCCFTKLPKKIIKKCLDASRKRKDVCS